MHFSTTVHVLFGYDTVVVTVSVASAFSKIPLHPYLVSLHGMSGISKLDKNSNLSQ